MISRRSAGRDQAKVLQRRHNALIVMAGSGPPSATIVLQPGKSWMARIRTP
jgi:hypothetical protein